MYMSRKGRGEKEREGGREKEEKKERSKVRERERKVESGKKKKSVVYRSQLLGPWRQQALHPAILRVQPRCPHWHRYN